MNYIKEKPIQFICIVLTGLIILATIILCLRGCVDVDCNAHFIIRSLMTLIIFILSLLSICWLYKLLRDAKERKKEYRHVLRDELGRASLVLMLVLGVETIWVLWIGVKFPFSSVRSSINIADLLYESFIIIITFSLVITIKMAKKFQSENIDYADLEDDINRNMSFAQNSYFYALSLDDFNNFFDETLGFWYFCEQARHIKDAREKVPNVTIVAKRIVVLDGTIEDNNELCKRSFGVFTKLTHSQINMKNLYLLHRLFGIQLYLVPIENILKILDINIVETTIFNKRGQINKEILQQYDRILINDSMLHPVEKNKQFRLDLDNDDEKKNKIKNIFDGSNSSFDLNNFEVKFDGEKNFIIYPSFN